MANIRLIRGRIKSAKNIAQITKAMELVAASKMRKAQAQAMAGKLYAHKIADMVHELSSRVSDVTHPLMQTPTKTSGKKLAIVISSNKGLCGALNTNLFRFLLHEHTSDTSYDYLTLGKKGADFLSIIRKNVIADFSDKTPFIDTVPALVDLASSEFLKGTYEGVELIYSEFVSVLRQTPTRRLLLPLSIEKTDTETKKDMREFLIEPSPKEVFETLLPHYVENLVRDAILQAEASEHSARMMAMRNATDNAKSFVAELTLVYNRARQEKITYELADIVTARSAVES